MSTPRIPRIALPASLRIGEVLLLRDGQRRTVEHITHSVICVEGSPRVFHLDGRWYAAYLPGRHPFDVVGILPTGAPLPFTYHNVYEGRWGDAHASLSKAKAANAGGSEGVVEAVEGTYPPVIVDFFPSRAPKGAPQ